MTIHNILSQTLVWLHLELLASCSIMWWSPVFLKNIISLSIHKYKNLKTNDTKTTPNLNPFQQLSRSEIKFGIQVPAKGSTMSLPAPCPLHPIWDSRLQILRVFHWTTPITSGKQKNTSLESVLFLHNHSLTQLPILPATWYMENSTPMTPTWLTASWIFIASVLTTPPTNKDRSFESLRFQHWDPLPRTYSIAPGGTSRGEHILEPSCICIYIYNMYIYIFIRTTIW